MQPLLKIRAERDQMSAIERRIADYILENSHLLRDYSSQQLANALGISQSSVVKFSQKLGFKGYPDLKYSVGEAIARGTGNGGDDAVGAGPGPSGPHAAIAENLWQGKARAEEETRLINPPASIDAIAAEIHGARRIFVIGLGQDGIPARAFAMRLSLAGILAVHHVDPVLMAASTSTADARDLLLAFSEHGRQAALCHVARQFRERGGKVVSVTRHTANPLRAQAGASLLVSAHDERAHIEPLLYQSALQHLLDLIFVLVCEAGAGRLGELAANVERIQDMLDD
ncbi:MurR/RpiR family transcriptional regulator [Montanilutibacter psychrotolerans]|uniref:MurR/RpiR family transcriptional regulator n=1 Tax=Montanilutibacter psychrotolerans TaxID=1327343 RepID=A0A3M8T1K7_9GAMM|nr:MurR/RpiR family transcriptional regulator [Lysobacter psychrotolerans]RNF85394.1 MurR/RpiR family transcriptional regulator [Lysobacter psychrotolerans]